MTTDRDFLLEVTIDAQTERFEQLMERAGRTVETSVAGMDKATQRAGRQFATLEGRLDPAAKAATRLARDTEKVQRALDKGAVSSDRAAKLQARLNDQYEQSIARLRQLDGAQGAATARVTTNARQLQTATTSTRNFGGAAQNASFQVADFATQIASGTSATRALAQQLPQLLGGFGLIGAAIGAAVAVAGALAPILFDVGEGADAASTASKALDAAQKATNKTLADGVDDADELRKKYSELTAEARKLEGLQIDAALRKTEQAIDAQRRAIDRQLEGLEEARTLINNLLEQGAPESRFADSLAVFDAIDAFRAGGSATELVSTLNNLAQGFERGGEEAQKLVDSVLEQAVALEDLKGRQDDLTEARERLNASTDSGSQSTDDNTGSTDDNARAQRDLDTAYQSVTGSLREQIELQRLDARERAITQAVMEAQNEAMEEGNLLLPEQVAKVRELAGELFDLRNNTSDATDAQQDFDKALKDQGRELERYAREVERTGRQVGETFTDGILNSMDDGLSGITDLFERWIQSLATTAINNAIVVPISTQIVGAAPGLFGISQPSGAAAQAQQAAGGASMVSNATSGVSLLSNIGDGLTTPFVSAEGLANFAPGLFSTGSGAQLGIPSGGGPAIAAGAPNGTANLLAQSFNPLTMLGGLGGSLLGGALFEGGDPYARMGLSTLGGIGGSIGGTALGGAIGGSILGASAGAVLGPIGALVGALAGDFLGSLFGNDTPPAGLVGSRLQFRDGRVSGIDPRSGQKDVDKEDADQIRDAVVQGINTALDFSGASVANPFDALFNVINRDKTELIFRDSQAGLDTAARVRDEFGLGGEGQGAIISDQANDFEAIIRALLTPSLGIAEEIGEDVATAVANSVAENADDLLKDVQFAANLDDTVEALSQGVQSIGETVAGAQVEQLNGLADAVGVFLDKTKELGLDLPAATEATREYLERQLGIADALPIEEMTAFEQQQLRLKTTVEQIQDPSSEFAQVLERVGISADDAAAAVQGQIAANDQLRSVTLALEAEGLRGAADELLGLADDARVLGRDLEAGRINAGQLSDILEQRMSPALSDLGSESVNTLLNALTPLTDEIDGLGVVLDQLSETTSRATTAIERISEEISDIGLRARAQLRTQFRDIFDVGLGFDLRATDLIGTDTGELLANALPSRASGRLGAEAALDLGNSIIYFASTAEEAEAALQIVSERLAATREREAEFQQIEIDARETLIDQLERSQSTAQDAAAAFRTLERDLANVQREIGATQPLSAGSLSGSSAGDLLALQEELLRSQFQDLGAEFREAAETALNGSGSAQRAALDQLPDLARAFNESRLETLDANDESQRVFQEIQNTLAQAEDVASEQATAAERTVERLEDQIAAQQDAVRELQGLGPEITSVEAATRAVQDAVAAQDTWRDAQLDLLARIEAAVQAQQDALQSSGGGSYTPQGRDSSRSQTFSGSVEAGVEYVPDASGGLSTVDQSINAIYERQLGRDADSAGLNFYREQYDSGKSLARIEDEIRNNALAGARAFGGPVSGGSAYLVGEQGPEIMVAGTSGGVMSNADLSAMVDAVVSVTGSIDAGLDAIAAALQEMQRNAQTRLSNPDLFGAASAGDRITAAGLAGTDLSGILQAAAALDDLSAQAPQLAVEIMDTATNADAASAAIGVLNDLLSEQERATAEAQRAAAEAAREQQRIAQLQVNNTALFGEAGLELQLVAQGIADSNVAGVLAQARGAIENFTLSESAAQTLAQNVLAVAENADAASAGISILSSAYAESQRRAEQAARAIQDELNAAIDRLIAGSESRIDSLQDQLRAAEQRARGYRDEAQSLERVAESFARVADGLKQAQQDLLLSDLSPLSDREKLGQAEAAFEQAREQAFRSDLNPEEQVAAFEQLNAAGREFLQVSQDFNASSVAYQDDFTRVLADLQAAEGIARGDASVQGAFAQNARDAAAREIADLSGTIREQIQVERDLTAAIEANRDQFASAADATAFFEALRTDVMPQFASGGITRPGSNLVHGDEAIFTSPSPALVLNARQLQAGAGGSGDTKALREEVAALRGEIARLTNVSASGFQQVSETVEKGNKHQSQQAKAALLKASGD